MTNLLKSPGRTPQVRAAQHAQRILARIAGGARALADQRALGALASRLMDSREHQHLRPLSTPDAFSFVQNVRRELWAKHPGTRFFVYKDMLDGVRVCWVDGPTALQVGHSLGKFQLQASGQTHFNRVYGAAHRIVVRRSCSPALLCRAAVIAFEANSRVLIGHRRPSVDQLIQGDGELDVVIEELQMTVSELISTVAEGVVGAG